MDESVIVNGVVESAGGVIQVTKVSRSVSCGSFSGPDGRVGVWADSAEAEAGLIEELSEFAAAARHGTAVGFVNDVFDFGG